MSSEEDLTDVVVSFFATDAGGGDISGMPAMDSDAVGQVSGGSPLSSTETLLRNIQSLLKVAADNARQQERQISYEKGEWIESRAALWTGASCIALKGAIEGREGN